MSKIISLVDTSEPSGIYTGDRNRLLAERAGYKVAQRESERGMFLPSLLDPFGIPVAEGCADEDTAWAHAPKFLERTEDALRLLHLTRTTYTLEFHSGNMARLTIGTLYADVPLDGLDQLAYVICDRYMQSVGESW